MYDDIAAPTTEWGFSELCYGKGEGIGTTGHNKSIPDGRDAAAG